MWFLYKSYKWNICTIKYIQWEKKQSLEYKSIKMESLEVISILLVVLLLGVWMLFFSENKFSSINSSLTSIWLTLVQPYIKYSLKNIQSSNLMGMRTKAAEKKRYIRFCTKRSRLENGKCLICIKSKDSLGLYTLCVLNIFTCVSMIFSGIEKFVRTLHSSECLSIFSFHMVRFLLSMFRLPKLLDGKRKLIGFWSYSILPTAKKNIFEKEIVFDLCQRHTLYTRSQWRKYVSQSFFDWSKIVKI